MVCGLVQSLLLQVRSSASVCASILLLGDLPVALPRPAWHAHMILELYCCMHDHHCSSMRGVMHDRTLGLQPVREERYVYWFVCWTATSPSTTLPPTFWQVKELLVVFSFRGSRCSMLFSRATQQFEANCKVLHHHRART